ncbi:Histone H2A deubiquitinase (DUF3755) [Citrus sinensis]|uniref:Histone H2A deubiquitinase (DUF3755) n=1 Tax=Citrus sinensis TaxID=2711 RepID=A0ACB8N756_CITSI|nr:Histone H2A deubiquitinase (DUF3755) [Citrus sinensis]
MAASANPVGNNNNQEGSSAAQKSTANGVSVNSSNNGVPMRVSVRLLPHAHNLDFSEKILLVSRLWYASDSAVNRYAKIAKQLKDKTVRDVALRCRWMTKKENGKRRKEDHNSARKNKDRKEKATDSSAKSSSHLAARPNGPSYAPPMIPMDTDDGISYRAIGGITGDILEQNAQMFNQISANFGTFQNVVVGNSMVKQGSENKELWILNDMPEIMKQMPPLPVKVNDDLANSFLPRPSHQMNS